jgi:hypothetical protein
MCGVVRAWWGSPASTEHLTSASLCAKFCAEVAQVS